MKNIKIGYSVAIIISNFRYYTTFSSIILIYLENYTETITLQFYHMLLNQHTNLSKHRLVTLLFL